MEPNKYYQMKHVVKTSGLPQFVKVLITKPSSNIHKMSTERNTNREPKSFKGSYYQVTEVNQ